MKLKKHTENTFIINNMNIWKIGDYNVEFYYAIYRGTIWCIEI